MSIEIPIGNEVAERKTGRNVRIRAYFLRHGEKGLSTETGETGLTERGKQMSAETGRELPASDAIKTYSSDTDRTIKTAEIINEASKSGKKLSFKLANELEFNYEKGGNWLTKNMEIKKRNLGEDFDSQTFEEQHRRMRLSGIEQADYYLQFGNQRPDPETFSPVETAAQFSLLIDRYVRMTEKLYDDTNLELINITHDFNIAAFLKEVLIREVNGETVKGFNSISEIGGSMDFNEGFEIEIISDDVKKKHIKLVLRGVDYNLDMKRFDELLALAKSQGKDLNEGSI